MTILISLFGFAGRFAGDLLSSALGWASSLLFGRVPQAHQRYLVLMMAGSFLWVIVMLSLVLPSIGSFLLAATPHPPFIDKEWLGGVLLIAAIVLPLGIGLAGALVPSDRERQAGLAMLGEFLRGYLLAPLISGLLIWLAIVGMVRMVRSKRQGWSDAHVPIVVEPGGYEQLAVDVKAAVESADLSVAVRDAPRALTVPAWLLTKVASDNVRKLRPDHLLELTGRHLRIGIFPSDVAISGPDGSRTRARAAILSRLTTAAVHLTISAEAQGVEDQLRRVALANASGAAAKTAFARIDASLLELPIQTDEWDLLYRLRLQVERDLLIGAEPGTAFPGHEMTARHKGTAAPAAPEPLRSEREEASKSPAPGRDEAPRSATASS